MIRYLNFAYLSLVLISVLWSTPVLAASFDTQVGEIVAGAYISVTILSLLGGTMRTLYRLNSGVVAVKSPALGFVINIFSGEIAGWLMFLFLSSAGMSPVMLIPGIFAASGAAPFVIRRFIPEKFGLDMDYTGK